LRMNIGHFGIITKAQPFFNGKLALQGSADIADLTNIAGATVISAVFYFNCFIGIVEGRTVA
jgi:hypothetical protein